MHIKFPKIINEHTHFVDLDGPSFVVVYYPQNGCVIIHDEGDECLQSVEQLASLGLAFIKIAEDLKALEVSEDDGA